MSKSYKVIIVVLGLSLSMSFISAYKKINTYPVHKKVTVAQTGGFYHFSLSLETFDTLLTDANGVFIFDYGESHGKQYNPVYISCMVMALVPLVKEPRVEKAMRQNLDFLIESSVETKAGNVVFPYKFDFPSHSQKAPWYSAMAQGQCASAFLWGNRLFREEKYFECAKAAINALMNDQELALTKSLNEGIWLKEYPGYEFCVLDGSLTAICGVYDLYKTMKKNQKEGMIDVKCFLDKCLMGFKSNHDKFNWHFGGLFYSDKCDVPTQSYYNQNMMLLQYLAQYDRMLVEIRDKYSIENQSGVQRLLSYYEYRLIKKLIRPIGIRKKVS